ncbi:MAG: gamma-glutamyltransferase [Solirubrobacteraceae bacterium]
MDFRSSPARAPAVGGEAMVSSSQPLATISGLDLLREGGNAVDAALCMAAVLCVTEPDATGLGGDLFALVRDPAVGLLGLDAAGPAPGAAPVQPPAMFGPRSVDVPGAVAGWGELSQRLGRVGLERCLRPAIELAKHGVPAGFNCASAWTASPRAPEALGPPPGFGQRFRLPQLAQTLEAIAAEGPAYLYRGPLAQAIVEATWLTYDDLREYHPRWVEPLIGTYHGVEVAELPPPTQGVAVLEALAILGERDPGLREEIVSVSLALEDALRTVRDGADVQPLLSGEHVHSRRAQLPVRVSEPSGGTVCLCVVDRDGMAVTLMQSLYEPFGSGIVAGESGVVLNNRAACFSVQGNLEPGKRPYHTLIPGMLMRGNELVGPFAVMGAFIQAQAHVQFITELMRNGLDPQAALDRGRFRIDGDVLSLEEPLWPHAAELGDLGFRIDKRSGRAAFGGGQAIVVRDGTLFGGSDARKDGCALGI